MSRIRDGRSVELLLLRHDLGEPKVNPWYRENYTVLDKYWRSGREDFLRHLSYSSAYTYLSLLTPPS